MKLDRFNELSRGKKILIIIGLNIIMISVYSLLLADNITAILSGASNELTVQSWISVFINASIIFVKYVAFLISFIVINIMLIKNKLKAALITFIVVVLITLVVGVMQAREYNGAAKDLSEFVSAINVWY